MIKRTIETSINSNLFKGRVVTLLGARRVGKTTLVKDILRKHEALRTRYLNCDLTPIQRALSIQDAEPLKAYLGDYDLVVLDEAQNVPHIGKVLKILVDTYPEIQIIATGSSSFSLSNQVGEPLTGRVYPFELFAPSLSEIAAGAGYSAIEPKLDRLLRFGSYPSLVDASEEEARKQLEEITSNYLYKDILQFLGVKKSSVLSNLLRLLALQIGNEVSYAELATNLGIDRRTVANYIDILEQCYIIFRLGSLSRNLRKEIAKSQKIYFFDLGVRNSLLLTHTPLVLRTDIGALWENFCIAERLKFTKNNGVRVNRYFWRTYDQNEIDLVEERDGVFSAFEFKWSPDTRARIPNLFLETYPESTFEKIDPNNYWRFLM